MFYSLPSTYPWCIDKGSLLYVEYFMARLMVSIHPQISIFRGCFGFVRNTMNFLIWTHKTFWTTLLPQSWGKISLMEKIAWLLFINQIIAVITMIELLLLRWEKTVTTTLLAILTTIIICRILDMACVGRWIYFPPQNLSLWGISPDSTSGEKQDYQYSDSEESGSVRPIIKNWGKYSLTARPILFYSFLYSPLSTNPIVLKLVWLV